MSLDSMNPDLVKKQFKIIGTRPRRPDGIDKVTGRARYGADFNMPGQLDWASCCVRLMPMR